VIERLSERVSGSKKLVVVQFFFTQGILSLEIGSGSSAAGGARGLHTCEKIYSRRAIALPPFCPQDSEQVEKLISIAPTSRAYICNECAAFARPILEDEKREQAAATDRRLPRPPEIKQFLDG